MRTKYAFLAFMASLILLLGWREQKREQHPVTGVSCSARRLSPEDDRRQALQAEQDCILKRLNSKLETVQKVIDGKWSLHQAAARFAELDVSQSRNIHAFWRATCPGDTDEERYCWTVLRFTAAVLQDRPAQARAMRERLQAELPEHLRRQLADDLLSTEWWKVSLDPARGQAESPCK